MTGHLLTQAGLDSSPVDGVQNVWTESMALAAKLQQERWLPGYMEGEALRVQAQLERGLTWGLGISEN